MVDVACVGILVADVVGKPIDGLPERGKLQLADTMELHSGGCAASTGVALSCIGISTAILGMVGQDGFGDFMVQAMEKHGLDASGIVRSARANTSATMVMVHSDGERSFVHYLGANAEFSLADVKFDLIESARLVHVGGSNLMTSLDGEPTAELLRRARAAGVMTSLDTAWDSRGRWIALIAPCFEHLDYFVPSIEEARMITGKHRPEEVAAFLIDRGVKTVGLKMGGDGCYIRTRDAELRVPAFKVDAVDALGAGDSFAAGFLTGVIQGWDLEKTARFANAVGAMSVMSLGATTGIRSMAETLAFMEKHGSR